MRRRFLDLPVLFHLFAVAAAAMFLPSIFALSQEAYFEARMFLYTGVLGLLFLAMVALAMANSKIEETGVQQLGSLGLGFVIFQYNRLFLFLRLQRTMRPRLCRRLIAT